MYENSVLCALYDAHEDQSLAHTTAKYPLSWQRTIG